MKSITEPPVAVAVSHFSNADILEARKAAGGSGKSLIEHLQASSGMDARSFVARLAETAGMQALCIHDMHQMQPAFDLLSYAEMLQRGCLALRHETGRLQLVLANPFDAALRDWAELRFNGHVHWRIAHADDITAFLAWHEDKLRAINDEIIDCAKPTATVAAELSLKSISEDGSPVVRLVNSTIYDALKLGASDIHLESLQAAMLIKYRIDGVLTRIGAIQGIEAAEQAISRIKVMAELDIAERRVPQDGRFKIASRGREIDFRVSIMPSIHGEDAVLRVLDKQSLSNAVTGLNLDSLGFDEGTKAMLRRLAHDPYGMLLVTGPTGSGKTTSLYAAISETNNGRDKIITIEDPIEYQLPGVLQIPVNERKGLTFARGLRSILRHDPDKIMVGEIRDGETAQIALQAALTGHLVFTTVHANNVFDVIGRFMHMGVDPYNLVSAVNAIVAQRLVRLNCTECSIPALPGKELLSDSGIFDTSSFSFHAGQGCGQCRGIGYKGRRAIAELLVLNDELRELIVARAPLRHIKEAARNTGMRSLREAGLDLVRRGETTLEELNRVTFVV